MRPRILSLFAQAFRDWNRHSVPRLAAALAYYTTFALAPLLLIVTAVAGLVFGEEAVRGQLSRELTGLVGPSAADLINKAVQKSSDTESGVIATVVGVVTLLIGTTGVFVELQSALNIIWEVPPRKGGNWLTLVRVRLISFAMILAIGFLLLVSLVMSAAAAALGAWVAAWLPWGDVVLQAFSFAVSFATTGLLFAMIYKVLPDRDIPWGDVWFGAVVTAMLFSIGRFLIALYLGRSTVASTYGAAGSLAILLVWIYYSAQIIFFGAELTHVWAKRRSSRSTGTAPAARPSSAAGPPLHPAGA